jgi:hypothetical protein
VTAALLLALALAAPAPRPAAPAAPLPRPADEAELSERLEAALGAIHGRATPEAWRSLGPAAAPALARLARDEAALPSRRARAVEGLSHLGGAEAGAVMRELAARPGLPPAVRLEALRGAGRLLPPVEVGRVVGPVLRGGGHPVERAQAAEVLAERAPAACGEIRVRAASEPAAGRPRFDRALRRCAAQGR